MTAFLEGAPPPLSHDRAIAAVICAKNAWLHGDSRRPGWVEINGPWILAFAYDDHAMVMCLYVSTDDDPQHNATSRLSFTPEQMRQMRAAERAYADLFATNCVATMEAGVLGLLGWPIAKITFVDSVARWPRKDPPR